jgi:hypothetical protein
MKDTDYVTLYAEKLKEDPETFFTQQRKFIEAQMHSSSSFFKKMCEGEDFKTCARRYLRKRGLV